MKMIIHFSNRWIQLVEEDDWFYARRPQGTRHVLVVALTPEQELLLVEQYRVAVGSKTIELPAGMFGENESLLAAAARELEEETGYRGFQAIELGSLVTSPGITDERAHVVLVLGAVRVSEGGGLAEEGESTKTHVVKVNEVTNYLEGGLPTGVLVSATIYAAMVKVLRYMATNTTTERGADVKKATRYQGESQ